MGDMAQVASDQMIDTMNANLSIKESIRDGLKALRKALRDEMGYENAPRHEKLLIEQIATCWLDVYQVQHRYATELSRQCNISVAEHLNRRLTASQARYLKPIGALAKVRKLARTEVAQTLMLNVAKQQINAALGGVSVLRRCGCGCIS